MFESKIHHARHAPNVSTRPPLCTKNDLWRPVLPCLDIVCKVMANPAGVSQISNLDGNDVAGGFFGCGLGGGLVQRDAGYFSLQDVSGIELA